MRHNLKIALAAVAALSLVSVATAQYADPNVAGVGGMRLASGTNTIAVTTTNATGFLTWGATSTNVPCMSVRASTGGKIALLTRWQLTTGGTTNWLFFDWRRGMGSYTNSLSLLSTNTALNIANYESAPSIAGYWAQAGAATATLTTPTATFTNFEFMAPTTLFLVGIWNTNGVGAVTNLILDASTPYP